MKKIDRILDRVGNVFYIKDDILRLRFLILGAVVCPILFIFGLYLALEPGLEKPWHNLGRFMIVTSPIGFLGSLRGVILTGFKIYLDSKATARGEDKSCESLREEGSLKDMKDEPGLNEDNKKGEKDTLNIR